MCTATHSTIQAAQVRELYRSQILQVNYKITRAAPLPCRLYPAALGVDRNFKVWGERVLLLGRPTSPLPPGNLPHDLEVSGGGGGG